MKYKKKPVVIDAVQYLSNEYSYNHIIQMGCPRKEYDTHWAIPTLEGEMTVNHGDYVIKGVKGEFYPCKPDIFEMTYELIESIQERQHLESSECWCGPTLIQAIDDEHNCEVWSHKGHEELNQ